MFFKLVVHQGSANTAGLGNTLKRKDKGGEEAKGKKKKKKIAGGDGIEKNTKFSETDIWSNLNA